MKNHFKNAQELLNYIAEESIVFVDFRFTDYKGKWHHVSFHHSALDEDMLEDGVLFDGSSIAGWKAINESDMQLKPDYSTAVLDPFAAQKTVYVICDIVDPVTGQPYERDPRSTAKKAEAYLKSTGVADAAYVGAEAEFFVFDDVKTSIQPHKISFEISSVEGDSQADKEIEGGNKGHRPGVKGGYFPVPPVDSANDLRAEMLSVMAEIGLPVDKHHHEVAAAQQELGFTFDRMLQTADNIQQYKYVVHNVADMYGKTATFMPKPIMGDNGSGMHTHFSLWKENTPLFAGTGYADLSDKALYFIGGIIKHARALNAFTNPTTNSYKRLVPGFEAPVLLAYSARNRSASCRIPFGSSPKSKRVEIRFPDTSANPYLAFAAMMMAGLDGIENKLSPGAPMDKNLYDLPPEENAKIPTVCSSLDMALDYLDRDREFLTRGGVFSDDMIDAYIALKMQEVTRYRASVEPCEYDMYYAG